MKNNALNIVFECISAALLCATAFPLIKYKELNGVSVPQHFSHGNVDIWGTRRVFVFLLIVAVFLYVILSICQKHPSWLTLPNLVLPEKGVLIAQDVALYLKLWIMVWIFFLSISSYLIAVGRLNSINIAIKWVIIGCAIVHLMLLLGLKK